MMLQAIHPYSHKLIRAKESMFFVFPLSFSLAIIYYRFHLLLLCLALNEIPSYNEHSSSYIYDPSSPFIYFMITVSILVLQ